MPILVRLLVSFFLFKVIFYFITVCLKIWLKLALILGLLNNWILIYSNLYVLCKSSNCRESNRILISLLAFTEGEKMQRRFVLFMSSFATIWFAVWSLASLNVFVLLIIILFFCRSKCCSLRDMGKISTIKVNKKHLIHCISLDSF